MTKRIVSLLALLLALMLAATAAASSATGDAAPILLSRPTGLERSLSAMQKARRSVLFAR